MSLKIKNVSFGNASPLFSVQRNFGVPVLNTPQNPQPQQSIAQVPQTMPVPQAPVQTVTVPVQTAPMMPQIIQGPQNLPAEMPAAVQTMPAAASAEAVSAKTLGYVAAGLALVSLGINGVGAVRNRSAKNLNEALGKVEQQVVTKIEEKISNLSQKTDNAIDALRNQISKEADERVGLGKFQDGIIGDIKKQLNKVEEMASKNSEVVVVGKASNFLSREVEINGSKMQLATTLHGYGRYTGELESSLRAESTNRMFGLVDRSNMAAPDSITIRVPTVEFKGITSTGGMSIVPREVMANLGAFINNKQDVRLIVDMPMFLGEVENNALSGKQTFYALEALGNNKFNWVSKATKPGGKDSVVVGNLERIANTQIPIYDDTHRTVQDVEVYMAKGLSQEVDYNLLRQYLQPEALAAYDRGINNYREAYAQFAPKAVELKKEIAQKTAPLIEKLKDKNLSVQERGAIEAQIKEIRKPIEDFISEHGKLWNEGIVELTGDADGHIKAKIKFDGVFYKNEKFDMKGPRFDGKDGNKNIYDDKAINAGEAERFMYFDKYFYEFLTKSKEQTTERLGADLIIGNDWHTGGISAMMRLLSKAKEVVGDLPAPDAAKLKNTPVVTILHNARLAGATAHSNAKLLNILFGEHAATIVENAYMPNVYDTILNAAKKAGYDDNAAVAKAKEISAQYDLPSKCWNGLMHNSSVNPQTMATAYSDVIIPVSDKYMEEIATQGVYGRENFELFRLRKFASDNQALLKGQKTIVGVTNGCDKVNNILTDEGARLLENQLSLPAGSIKPYDGNGNILDWHNHNKKVILDKVIADVKNPGNPMKLENPEMTDLTGVNENTMIVSTAGRIVDQKGLDIFAQSIEEFLKNHKITDGNYPVFYAQGVGDKEYIDAIMAIKNKVAKSPELGGEAAAKRIVFANLFSEPGRYDACKLMSDFSIMSSWFEPCGLVHKEIVAKSGAIPIVNKTGGLTSGLTDGIDAIFSKFKPDEPSKQAVIAENKVNFAEAMGRAFDVFNNKEKLAQMMKKSYENDFSWLVKDGPMAQYVKMFTDLKVIKPQVLESVNAA